MPWYIFILFPDRGVFFYPETSDFTKYFDVNTNGVPKLLNGFFFILRTICFALLLLNNSLVQAVCYRNKQLEKIWYENSLILNNPFLLNILFETNCVTFSWPYRKHIFYCYNF